MAEQHTPTAWRAIPPDSRFTTWRVMRFVGDGKEWLRNEGGKVRHFRTEATARAALQATGDKP